MTATAILALLLFSPALALAIGRGIRRADEQQEFAAAQHPEPVEHVVKISGAYPNPAVPVPPSRRRLPERSPLDLRGFELDSAFYGVLAPSFAEYE